MADTPASMGDHLGNAGPLPTITWQSKELQVMYPDNFVAARVELAIAKEAVDEATSLAQVTPSIVDYTSRLLVNREHRMGGTLNLSKLGTPEGQYLMLWACVSCVKGQEWFTLDECAAYAESNPVQAKLTLALVVPGFLELAAARKKVPPEQRAKMLKELKSAILSS